MKKFSNTLMLVLVVAALFYFYKEMRPVKINAAGLVKAYSVNKTDADKRFLEKDIEITGTVRAFYELSEIGNVLELDDGDDEIYLYCFFLKKTDEDIARQFNQAEDVTFVGTCAGLKRYNVGEVLRFNVKKIKN